MRVLLQRQTMLAYHNSITREQTPSRVIKLFHMKAKVHPVKKELLYIEKMEFVFSPFDRKIDWRLLGK